MTRASKCSRSAEEANESTASKCFHPLQEEGLLLTQLTVILQTLDRLDIT